MLAQDRCPPFSARRGRLRQEEPDALPACDLAAVVAAESHPDRMTEVDARHPRGGRATEDRGAGRVGRRRAERIIFEPLQAPAGVCRMRHRSRRAVGAAQGEELGLRAWIRLEPDSEIDQAGCGSRRHRDGEDEQRDQKGAEAHCKRIRGALI
jgi:hypothetical protein